jgi:hypothetical protein
MDWLNGEKFSEGTENKWTDRSENPGGWGLTAMKKKFKQ